MNLHHWLPSRSHTYSHLFWHFHSQMRCVFKLLHTGIFIVTQSLSRNSVKATRSFPHGSKFVTINFDSISFHLSSGFWTRRLTDIGYLKTLISRLFSYFPCWFAEGVNQDFRSISRNIGFTFLSLRSYNSDFQILLRG